MSLQNECWLSVERRGFFHDENIPAACHNMHQMESFLSTVEFNGRLARYVRKNYSVPAGTPPNALMADALLLAQFVRLVEEVGELAEAIANGDTSAALTESADVYVTLANVHTALGGDLESTVSAKLQADELRGQMHGERVTEVTA